jgi:hypothetical protein
MMLERFCDMHLESFFTHILYFLSQFFKKILFLFIDEDLMASGSSDKSIIIWDLTNKKATLWPHNQREMFDKIR